MKRGSLALMIIICVLLSFLFVMLFYSFYYVLEVKSVDVFVSTINETKISFNNDATSLKFIDHSINTVGKKFITVNNVREFPVRVDVIVRGSIVDFTSTNFSFVLDANSSTVVEVIISPKELGNFSGSLDFYFKRW